MGSGAVWKMVALCGTFLTGAFGAEITFARNVWPVLERRCVSCHQPGEIAPMSLTSYTEVRPWASGIREAVRSRSMPPWSAEPAEHQFRNNRAMTEAEIRTIAAWVDAGAKEGGAITPFTPHAAAASWKLGVPDMVLEVPGFAVPKTGVVPYSFVIFAGRFSKDVWIRAAEWHIDHRPLIHHINAFVRPPGSSFLASYPAAQIFTPTVSERGRRREGERVFDRRQLLLGYEPGYQPMPWLDNGAKLIKAGSDVVFEMHYTPKGTEAVDHSRLALYFASTPPAYRVLAIDTLRDLDLNIQPGDRNSVSHASMTLAQSARLLSIQPHMHLRGKAMEVRARFPDGSTTRLLSVPKYDFNWQTTYVLEDPLTLPAGTTLQSDAAFDNSAGNPLNPDPAALVHWGDQTYEEMHIAFLELVIAATADPDSLLQTAPKMIGSR